jgi:hypothetical protein
VPGAHGCKVTVRDPDRIFTVGRTSPATVGAFHRRGSMTVVERADSQA